MKKTILLLLFVCGLMTTNAVIALPTTGTTKAKTAMKAGITTDLQLSSVDEFLSLTPRTIREATGKKLSIKEIIQLKTAQKAVKKGLAGDGEDMPQWLYIILGIFGLAWIVMGIRDNWDGKNWWMNLIFVIGGGIIIGIIGLFCPFLWVAAGVPGLVHALIKMKEYY